MSPMLTRVLAVSVVLAPTAALVLARKRLGVLKTASWLVIWGVVIALGEHATWAMRLALHERWWLNPHSSAHYFMAGVYAAIGGLLLCVIARTLLQEGRRAGWYAVLIAFLIGGALEVVMNGPTGLLHQHGFASGTTPGGEAIFGYPFAWLAALVMAYKPIFRRAGPMDPVGSRYRRRIQGVARTDLDEQPPANAGSGSLAARPQRSSKSHAVLEGWIE